MNKLLLLILLCYSFNSYSEQKFNPYNNEWETKSPDVELKYNPFSNSHEYVPPTMCRDLMLIQVNMKWHHQMLLRNTTL